MKFKIGDRVKLRGFSSAGTAIDGLRGRISYNYQESSINDRYSVDVDNSGTVIVFESQCIRLLPAKPRRRVFISNQQLDSPGMYNSYAFITDPEKCCPGKFVEFVEVRRAKKAKG